MSDLSCEFHTVPLPLIPSIVVVRFMLLTLLVGHCSRGASNPHVYAYKHVPVDQELSSWSSMSLTIWSFPLCFHYLVKPLAAQLWHSSPYGHWLPLWLLKCNIDHLDALRTLVPPYISQHVTTCTQVGLHTACTHILTEYLNSWSDTYLAYTSCAHTSQNLHIRPLQVIQW